MRKLLILTSALTLAAAIVLPGLAGAASPNAATRAHWFAGSVSSVGSGSLAVGVLWTGPHDGALNGQTVNVAVNGSTTVVGKGGAPDQLQNVAAGDLVGIRATGQGSDLTALTATRIHVYCNCHWVGGTITAINGTSSLSVQVARTGPFDTVLAGQTVTIGLGGSTAYIQGRGKTPIGLNALSVGEGVGIVFSANGFFKAPGFNPATATFTATRVHAWAHHQVPPPSTDSDAAAQTAA